MKLKIYCLILLIFFISTIKCMEDEEISLIEEVHATPRTYSIGQYLKESKLKLVHVIEYNDTYYGGNRYTLVLDNLKINSLAGLGRVCDYIRAKNPQKPVFLNKIAAISLKKNNFTTIDLAEILYYLPSCRKFFLSENPLAKIINIKALKTGSYLDICSTDNDKLRNNIVYTEFEGIPRSEVVTNDKEIEKCITSKQNRPLRYAKHIGKLSLESFITAYILAAFLLNINVIPGNRTMSDMVEMGVFLQKVGYAVGFIVYFAYVLFMPCMDEMSKGRPYGFSQHYLPHTIQVKDVNP